MNTKIQGAASAGGIGIGNALLLGGMAMLPENTMNGAIAMAAGISVLLIREWIKKK